MVRDGKLFISLTAVIIFPFLFSLSFLSGSHVAELFGQPGQLAAG